jgi:hypothetical protein
MTTEKLHNDPFNRHMVTATCPDWLLAAEAAQA